MNLLYITEVIRTIINLCQITNVLRNVIFDNLNIKYYIIVNYILLKLLET